MKLLLIPATGVVAAVALLLGFVVMLAPAEPAAADQLHSCAPTLTQGDVSLTLSGHQWQNARTIVEVGRRETVPPRGWVIAVATALQESSLLNLTYGHLDSVGLFQQRDAWGSFSARTSPTAASQMFYTGGRGGQPGLLDIDVWQQKTLAEAAQAVQVSAYPDAYARWEAPATTIVEKITGESVSCVPADAWVLPLRRGVYSLTAEFGECSALWVSCHTGLDMAAPPGTPVMAIGAGTVTFAGYDGAYGNATHIQHAEGVASWYGHMSRIFIREGDHVRTGEVIGLVGDTGHATGDHLHFEIRTEASPAGSGTLIDPYVWLKEHGAAP
jgi:murein DD-endopeptidase MepM/ murein hydrolase activator NlpD